MCSASCTTRRSRCCAWAGESSWRPRSRFPSSPRRAMEWSMFEPLQFDFMQNAYAAGTIIAVVVAVVGFFVVLRGLTFAGDALAHVGFTGAAGVILVGW